MQTANSDLFKQVADGVLLIDIAKMDELSRIAWRQEESVRKQCLYTEHFCQLRGEGRAAFAVIYDMKKVIVQRFDPVQAVAVEFGRPVGWTKFGITLEGDVMFWKKRL